MIKKEYIQPAMEVNESETAQMIANSVTNINTTGLNDDNLNKSEDSGNVWEVAW